MNRLIIVGSPRIDGRSAHLAELLFEACIEEYPNDEVALAPVSTLDIDGCQGCDACRALMRKVEAWSQSETREEEPVPARCVIDDDMAEVYEFIDAADELVVVAPVYFAGVSSQLKALIDRLQPYFWSDARKQEKRSLTLHVVGEGGDPHGFEPLVGEVRSAFSCAGFELTRILDWVGKIDKQGEITAEAAEYTSTFEPCNSAFLREGEETEPVSSHQAKTTPTDEQSVDQRAAAPAKRTTARGGQHNSGQSQGKPKLKIDQKASPKKGGKRRG